VVVAGAMSITACAGQGASTAVAASTQDLTAFQKMVDDAMVTETTWNGPVETPTPPKDVKLAVVVCSSVVSGCVRQGQGMREAGEALGWDVDVYDGKGDPVAQNQAMTQAINSRADAILLAAVDPVPLSASMDLAKSKGIPVGTSGVGAAPGNGGAAFDVAPDYARWGKVLGAWIVTDSKGTANFLPTIDEEFASSTTIAKAMIETVEGCTGCTVQETEQFVVGDIGNGLGQRMASRLLRDPRINYMSGAFDSAAVDIGPALNSAGLGKRIRLVSCVGSPQNYGFIVNDDVQKVDMVQDDVYMGYAAVDQMIRLLVGAPLWSTPGVSDPRAQYGQGVPDQLLTKANIEDPSKDWAAHFDYASKYKQLWGVSG
jgi:ABC-type sugar transport system substrate-binding protein